MCYIHTLHIEAEKASIAVTTKNNGNKKFEILTTIFPAFFITLSFVNNLVQVNLINLRLNTMNVETLREQFDELGVDASSEVLEKCESAGLSKKKAF